MEGPQMPQGSEAVTGAGDFYFDQIWIVACCFLMDFRESLTF